MLKRIKRLYRIYRFAHIIFERFEKYNKCTSEFLCKSGVKFLYLEDQNRHEKAKHLIKFINTGVDDYVK